MQYTGMDDASCPITLQSLPELGMPVAFRKYPFQPYEATALVRWLQLARVHPLTRERVVWTHTSTEVIAALDIDAALGVHYAIHRSHIR